MSSAVPREDPRRFDRPTAFATILSCLQALTRTLGENLRAVFR